MGQGGSILVLKGYERAAAVLSLLGDEISQRVLSYVPENDAVSIISAAETLKTPTKDVLLDVVSEFNDYMATAQVEEHPAEEGTPAAEETGSPLDAISRASPKALAKALETERPEVSAYVLSHLPVEKIYDVLTLLKENRSLVEARLLSIKDVPISKELEEKVMKSISERLS
jgi:flagellar motor switch protein FliG